MDYGTGGNGAWQCLGGCNLDTGVVCFYAVLPLGDLLDTAFIHQVLNTDCIEKSMNLLTEFNP